MYLYEKLGYNFPLWKKSNYPDPIRVMISLDNQLRLSIASAENLLCCMDKSGVDFIVVMPVAPFVSGLDYLETSFQPWPKIRKAVNRAGSHRVLFGSDRPESEQLIPLKIARRAAGKDRESKIARGKSLKR